MAGKGKHRNRRELYSRQDRWKEKAVEGWSGTFKIVLEDACPAKHGVSVGGNTGGWMEGAGSVGMRTVLVL